MDSLSHLNKPIALIMAGGTGGHIFPALAVATELEGKGWKAYWLGSIGGMEEKLVAKTGIPLSLISIAGLRGNGFIGWLKAPFVLLSAIVQAIKIIGKVSPDIVIGFGGFVSGPGGLAAFLLRKPLLIHEQNAVVGLTNKMLAKIADQVFQAFPNTIQGCDCCTTIGNPIRQEIKKIERRKTELMQQPINILVIGGSRGATTFNQYLPSILAPLLREGAIKIHHQSGEGNLDETVENYTAQEIAINHGIEISEFIDDMAKAYSWADIVICRAGALTVSEVAAVGIAAIFIPYPFAVDDHQTLNASWLVGHNAAILIRQCDLQSKQANSQITKLIKDVEQIGKMAFNARKVAYLDATQAMSAACEMLMKEVG